MKRILLAIACLTLTFVQAQVDRSVQPKPGPAREVKIADYKTYDLDNGIKLIVVENHKLPRVTMSLVLNIDPIVEGDKAGYTSLAGDMLSEGTATVAKDDLNNLVDMMGARFSTGSSSLFISGLSKYTEELVKIAADVAMHPAFPETEFNKLKDQMLTGLKTNKDDPGAIMGNMMQANLYGKNHPYGEAMTEKSLKSVTLEDCKNFYNTYWKPNVAYIVMVGDIKPKAAKKLVKKYFGDWATGVVPTHMYNAPAMPSAPYVAFSNRDASVQSNIQISNVIDLKPGNADIAAISVANQILGGGSSARLFQNLREDKAYTYGSYSDYNSDRLIGSFTATAEVRNNVTDSAITQIILEIEKMRNQKVTEEELQNAKNFLAGSFGRSLESPQTVANFALNIIRYNLPEDYYKNYLARLEAVTLEDVQRVSQKYFDLNHMVIGVVGKAGQVADKLEVFGEVKYFDAEGFPTEKPSTPVPAGVTATSVIDAYLTAIGGEENLRKMKSFHQKNEAKFQGFTISTEVYWKAPNKYLERSASPMGNGEVKFDGTKGFKTEMGKTSEITGEELEELKMKARLWEELDWKSDMYNVVLDPNMSKVDDAMAYVLHVSKGDETTDYYFDVKTGLKLRQSESAEGPQGTQVINLDFMDYQTVNGISVPGMMTMPIGPGMVLEFKTLSLEVNQKIADSMFK